ncbi:DUF3084 domain-containing protein [Deinococcus sonorensis]|uniref:DUF3084 domain-containing protein n=2 Tax=Deinococcus sonorensis TaxID=309891 RepID=A0AAU7U9Y9_9DEIO
MLLAFLAFVVVLAGVVAYAADNIGRRVGRKHLRLFGLRPKTTALLVAVAAGMGISLLSLLAFFVLNRQAIRNIEQADQLRVELRGLKRDVIKVQAGLKTAQKERDEANSKARLAGASASLAQAQYDTANSELQDARATTKRLETQAQALRERVQALTTLRSSLEAQAKRNQAALTASHEQLARAQAQVHELDGRLGTVQQQIAVLDQRNLEAGQATAAAEARAQQAQQQAAQLQQQVGTLQASSRQLSAQRDQLTTQRDQLKAQRDQLAAQRNQLQAERTRLAAERDRIRKDVAGLQQVVAGLKAQSQALQADNATLRRNLSSSQADVTRLEDEYTRATSELSATRNAELIFPKNAIVYGAVVPTVRNLDTFLQQADAAAQSKGIRSSPAVRLSVPARQALETTLRTLNASTYVLCRSQGNAAATSAVDLSCAAQPNTVLYPHGSVIRQVRVSLQISNEALRSQLQDLMSAAILDLTRRGVPLEYVLNNSLDTSDLLSVLNRLAARGGSSAVIGVMPKADVRPGSRVDLYADLVQ